MKCTKCGAWTEVKETRKAPVWMVARTRECANGHRFKTFEVHATLISRKLITGTLTTYFKAVENRVALWQRKTAIIKDPRSTAEVAKEYHLSPDYVRQIRNGIKGPK